MSVGHAVEKDSDALDRRSRPVPPFDFWTFSSRFDPDTAYIGGSLYSDCRLPLCLETLAQSKFRKHRWWG